MAIPIPEPRFNLKEVSAKEPTLIYLHSRYSIANQPQRVMMSTGEKILPSEWDLIKYRAIVSKKNLANGEINLALDKMTNSFKSAFRNLLLDDEIPTAQRVREKMEEKLNANIKIEATRATLYSFIGSFIEENKINKAHGTIQAYQSTFKRIKEFGVYSNKEFSFDDITLEWRAAFIKFLQGKGICRSTEGKFIKDVKYFMGEATERGLNNNFSFRSKSFSKPTEEARKIFLTKDEIQKIADVDLSNDKLKDIIRDYFLIACLTSLRYSDFSRIKKEHIQNDRIKIITKKTGQPVEIPLSSLARTIFQKYDYNLPKAPCNQVFNRYIKEIGEMAGLNEEVTIIKTIGGIKKTQTFFKFQLLSSHIGRSTLISNCILEGINSNAIMMLSGHRSHRVFSSYIRINQQQNCDALAGHNFFK